MKVKAAKKPKSDALPPLPPGAVLLAIDASSSAVGWAVFFFGKLVAASVIRAPSSRPSPERIEAHTIELGEVVEAYGVTTATMEWQSPYKAARLANATGLAILGQAQGAIFWELKRRGVPVDLVSERVWTRVGGWPASKKDRAARVRLMCPEYREAMAKDPKLDRGLDLADALGLAYWRLSK